MPLLEPIPLLSVSRPLLAMTVSGPSLISERLSVPNTWQRLFTTPASRLIRPLLSFTVKLTL